MFNNLLPLISDSSVLPLGPVCFPAPPNVTRPTAVCRLNLLARWAAVLEEEQAAEQPGATLSRGDNSFSVSETSAILTTSLYSDFLL